MDSLNAAYQMAQDLGIEDPTDFELSDLEEAAAFMAQLGL